MSAHSDNYCTSAPRMVKVDSLFSPFEPKMLKCVNPVTFWRNSLTFFGWTPLFKYPTQHYLNCYTDKPARILCHTVPKLVDFQNCGWRCVLLAGSTFKWDTVQPDINSIRNHVFLLRISLSLSLSLSLQSNLETSSLLLDLHAKSSVFLLAVDQLVFDMST